LKRQIDVFGRTLCLLSLVVAMMTVPHRAYAQEGAVTRLDLPIGRAYPYRSDEVITRVTVANPQVADAIVISEREIVANAVTAGEGDIILWLQSGRRIHFRVQVHTPADRMQISLSVKFAEVRKDALREFGLSGVYRDKNARVGTGLFSNDNAFNKADGTIELPSSTRFLTVLTDFGTDDLLAFLDAQEQSGRAHLLAEPTLITANREVATFLAGGEIPVPVVQSSGGQGNSGGVSVVFKEYGVRLRFTPEIVSDSLIKLQVIPEVSSLDFVNAVLLQGFRIPALLTRRMESTVDVKRNTSLVLSGMFSNADERVKTGVPLLMNIPILGQLFSSTRFQRNESELIVIVTPTMIDPLRPRAEDVMRLQPDTTKPGLDALQRRLPPNQRRRP
jgi:Flp pilus assembly secretin CpaC